MDPHALLQKMGWKQGQGLGRRNQGISTAIKPKVQLDRNGLGHNPATCLVEPWWAKVFNQTAQNVSVTESADYSDGSSVRLENTKHVIVNKQKRGKKPGSADEGMTLPEEKGAHVSQLICDKEQELVTNRRERRSRSKREQLPKYDGTNDELATNPQADHHRKEQSSEEGSTVRNSLAPDLTAIKCSMYKNFVKGTTFRADNCHQQKNSLESTPDAHKQSEADDDVKLKKLKRRAIVNPIDDVMWQTCEGRTGHKGARYGVLQGKMARVMRQESQIGQPR